MPPAEAAAQLAAGLALGAGLGVLCGFFRPLRPRFTTLADGLFLLAAALCWARLNFGICRGNIRLGCNGALFLGEIFTDWVLGPLLRPLFSAFWGLIGKMVRIVVFPVKKISDFSKILFASVKKWVTIEWEKCRYTRKAAGGGHNGRKRAFFRPGSDHLPP